MRQVWENAELNLIKLERKGFILNDRPEARNVHHVTCEAVTVMSVKHPKLFSQDRVSAKKWLDNKSREPLKNSPTLILFG
jgi:hypothetical protein